jgi:cytidylate kinase
VVAIDGPVGVGKSSVAARVAKELGFRHLDTGAMYRALALFVMRQPADLQENGAEIGRLAYSLEVEIGTCGTVLLDGQDITSAIRDEAVSRYVSRVADIREVREALVAQQRRLGLKQPSVLEGRDIGTVVFPDSACKIYLDASPEVRVQRRVDQLLRTGKSADPAAVREALLDRDARDRARPWGALRVADDAIMLDSTLFTEERVVQIICALVRSTPAFASPSDAKVHAHS